MSKSPLAITVIDQALGRQVEATMSFRDLRIRLFSELVALQSGEVSVGHAMAVAALARQFQQSAEAEIQQLRDLREDVSREKIIDGEGEGVEENYDEK